MLPPRPIHDDIDLTIATKMIDRLLADTASGPLWWQITDG
jgi:hypothetical protein